MSGSIFAKMWATTDTGGSGILSHFTYQIGFKLEL